MKIPTIWPHRHKWIEMTRFGGYVQYRCALCPKRKAVKVKKKQT